MTSFAAAAQVRRALGEKKCGHGGTLDPEATGVLPVLVGRATRLSDYFLTFHKCYKAGLKFGCNTDTGDVWGNVTSLHTEEQDRIASGLTETDIRRATSDFIGRISQTPPAYSALKIGGVSAYKLARKGIDPGLAAREVNVYDIRVDGFRRDTLTASISVECGRGTYIRTLCEDIAGRLGLLGTMASLVRTSYGPLSADDAVCIDEVKAFGDAAPDRRGETPDFLMPCDSILTFLDRIDLDEKTTDDYVHGRPVSMFKNGFPADIGASSDSRDARIYAPGGVFLGVGAVRDDSLKSRISFF